jgi:hypothetical protein
MEENKIGKQNRTRYSEPRTENKWGLSRKSNVAIAAIAGLAAVQQSKVAVIAIVVIAIYSLTWQGILDWFDKDDEY